MTQRPAYRHWLSILLVVLAAMYSLPVLADDTDTPAFIVSNGREVPGAEQIQEQIATLEQAATLNETVRNQALSLYRSALERLAAAENHAATTQRYRQAIENAPEQTRRLRERLEQAQAQAADQQNAIAQGEADGELKQVLAQRRAEFAALQSRLKDLEEQLRAQQSRPLAAREELAAAKKRREQAEIELQSPLVEVDSERLREARLAALTTQRHASNSQSTMLEQELLSHEARLGVVTAQRDLVQFQLQQQAEQLKRLQELANLQSRAEAAQAAQAAARAKREAWGSHAVLVEIAQVNAELSQQLSELVARLERTAAQQEQVGRQLDQVDKSYLSTRQQLEIAGLSEALGAALRHERSQLPNIKHYERSARQRQQHITDARLAQFQVEQQRRELAPAAEQVQALLERQADTIPTAAEHARIEAELSRMVQDRISLHDELAENFSRYIDSLADLHRDQKQLAAQTAQYATLLDESLFWIASSSAIGLTWFAELTGSARWLLDDGLWRGAIAAGAEGLADNPLVGGLVMVLFVLLLKGRRDIRQRLHLAAGRVGKVHNDHFGLTLQALISTPLLALPWPMLLYLAGWLISRPLEIAPMSVAVSQALQHTALVGFVIESFRQACRPEGLLRAHFGWSEQARRVLQRNLRWLPAIALPVIFLITLTEWQMAEQHRDTLGRLAFVAGSLALALFARRVLHPLRGAVGALREPDLSGAWWWLRYLGYPLTLAVPVLLAAMALYGYYYSALQLHSRLVSTAALLIGAGFAVNLLLRWLRIMERRLAMRRARARREAMLAERVASREGQENPAEAWPEAETQEIDLETIDDQSRSLVQLGLGIAIVIGLWLIWIDLLPALNIFNEIVLWQHAGGDGERLVPVTLVDLMLAAAIAVFTLMAARNLPGILEIGILSRLAIDAGTRYAVTAICRYLIVILGLIGAIGLLGIGWSKAQWLVAALGLGLGFGLQEIFANFVSGLIILFERPIRVGDTVTVGEQSGTVTRIRIRATTISDWDRREIIIPNKTFITERLVNWTLSDQVTRLLIPVSVAYASDPDLARELILEVARRNPRVMDEPEPSVYLTAFGDNALSFELRAFVREMADRLPLSHELHLGIIQALRANGIEIPYPQRDLHIRSIDANAELTGLTARRRPKAAI